MGSKAFQSIKHGAAIERVRTSTPQVTELTIHEATAPEEHPLVSQDENHEHFAVAEPNMGRTVGHIAVKGDPEKTEAPEVQINNHPGLPHINEANCAQILPAVLERSGFPNVDPASISIETPDV